MNLSNQLSNLFRLGKPTLGNQKTVDVAPQNTQISCFPIGPNGIPLIPLWAVQQHDDYTDCWVVIYDRVYDVTKFLNMHPGGADIIMDHAGRDATLAFHGTGHSNDAIREMRDYLIGELPQEECIIRKANGGGILSSGIPE